MVKGPFSAEQFTPTEWSSIADKAAFGNSLLQFIEADFERKHFTKALYNRLINCYSHIAHYDIHGFYEVWFSTRRKQAEFLRHALRYPCFGSPQFTFCDVERALQQEMITRNYLQKYELMARRQEEAAELALLNQLEAKYRGSSSESVMNIQKPATNQAEMVSMPVQQNLFFQNAA